MAAEMAGLFAPAGAAAAPTRDEPDAKKAKLHPERLAKWNGVAARALNPTGVSDLHAASTKDLWEWAAKGDKNCPYFSELAADESQGGAYRQGVGLSKAVFGYSVVAYSCFFKYIFIFNIFSLSFQSFVYAGGGSHRRSDRTAGDR